MIVASYRSKQVNIHMEHVYTHLYSYGCARKLKHLIFVNGGSIFNSALVFKDRRSISITHASHLLFRICLSSAHPLHARSIYCHLLTAMFHLFSIHAWHLLFFIYIFLAFLTDQQEKDLSMYCQWYWRCHVEKNLCGTKSFKVSTWSRTWFSDTRER